MIIFFCLFNFKAWVGGSLSSTEMWDVVSRLSVFTAELQPNLALATLGGWVKRVNDELSSLGHFVQVGIA